MPFQTNLIKYMLFIVVTIPRMVIAQQSSVVPVTVNNVTEPYKAGTPIVLNLTISNTLAKDVSIIGPPAVDDVTYGCRAHLTALGSNVEIDERPRKNRTRSSYPYVLASKASIQRVFEITRRYELSPGTYNVRLSCFYNDGVSSHESISNPINVTITP
jgi:hypothetical protein